MGDDDIEIELIGSSPSGFEEKTDPEDDPNVRLKTLAKDEGDGVRIFIEHKVLLEVRRHARTDLTRELAGALFGGRYTSKRGPFLEIREAIRAPGTTGSRAHVTVTPEEWSQIEEDRRIRCPGARMVGWYHTHPNLGVFLSSYDRFIHQSFFAEEWMVALVFDPVANVMGLWSLVNGRLRKRGFCEVIRAAAAPEPPTDEDAAGVTDRDAQRSSPIEGEQDVAPSPPSDEREPGSVLTDIAQPFVEGAEDVINRVRSAFSHRGKRTQR
ncbi:MAG: Mov34/MPN/PAD-1 family protein [Armatimonadota bacterium]